MARNRIKEYLLGYVRVEVRGKNPERLINLCLASGFPVWDYSSESGAVFFSTTLAKYKGIRRLARKARCVPHVVRRVGLPFAIAKVRKRPYFLLAALLVLAWLLYLSGSVWSIKVIGCETVDPGRIVRAAASAGLAPGARKSGISASSVETAIAVQVPELSWVYVRFQGTMAVVEVVEKSRPDSPEPGDVVASQDGVVESVLVLSGVPTVSPGQTVKRGDILIAGNPSGPMPGARGSVIAMTSYDMRKEIPLRQSLASRTGRKIEMTVLRWRGVELTLWGRSNAFEWYEVEDYPRWKAFEGTEYTLSVFTRVLYELKWEEVRLSPEEALLGFERKVKASIESQLPSDAKLVDLSCKLEAVSEDVVLARATLCVLQDIAEVRPWNRSENGGR